MRRGLFVALILAVLLTVPAAGQMQEGYLDVFMVKVKPEKRTEFDAIVKKMADANRRNKGDYWLATEVSFGEGNTVYFTSVRQSWGDIEKGMQSFMGALNKTLTPAGTGKIFQDFSNCIVSSRSELRRRRWDLSLNAASDPAAMNKMVGDARWVRTAIVRVRPGRTADYEARLLEIRNAQQRANPQYSTLVSQAVAGQQGTVFYITTLRSSLASFDTAPTPMRQLLGEDGYQKYLKTVAESVLGTETIVSRFLPGLSNAPEEIASAAPAFWNPKPPAPKAKPAADAAKPEAAKGTK